MIAPNEQIGGTPKSTKRKFQDESPDFKEAVELLSIYSTVENQLAELEANLNKRFLAGVDEIKPQYALLQATMQEASERLELIALRHPEWFAEKKSVKTPFGEMKFHKSSPLEVKNEEVSIVLIEARLMEINVKMNTSNWTAELENERASLAACLRERKELDLDAVGKLDDATLAKFRITRDEKQNFSIKGAKIDLGKAVKAASKKEVAKES